ncbi:MAG TPA: 2-oxo-4-hydroxy-4-carboxy-5-ureidoimidazoline decarboxylase [Alphaproteobacteria bacterium]|nr:2-oxo-4-hydroxy-4-carboxy-5-ureidoimidazoline decarboxylase [Alphaproteobacteria bacterium]
MSETTTLDTLNAAAQTDFVAALADIFEHSPWVAEAAVGARPFVSTEGLLAAMVAVVLAAPQPKKLALIRAHPDLADRLATAGDLTEASTAEQADAGLDQCSPDELKRFESLNDAYKAKFGFPFVKAVKGRSRAEILVAFARRLENDEAAEFDEALAQIAEIARLRLTSLIDA